MNKKKAVSILKDWALLIVASSLFFVLVGVTVFLNSRSVIGGLHPPVEEDLRVIGHTWGFNNASITLSVRNTCTRAISVASVRLNYATVAESNLAYGGSFTGATHTLDPGESGTIIITHTFISGIRYEIAVIPVVGICFSYVVGTQEDPIQENVRFYIKDPSDGDNIYAGMPVGTVFAVQVWIDSPPEWFDTAEGIVGFTISVKVDPAVLEPIRAATVPDLDLDGWSDSFLDEFCKYKEWTGTLEAPEAVNKTTGTIAGFAQCIGGFTSLNGGAGGSGMLMWFWFKSKSTTEYSLIDFIDARFTNARGETYTVGVVEDGHYNYPSE